MIQQPLYPELPAVEHYSGADFAFVEQSVGYADMQISQSMTYMNTVYKVYDPDTQLQVNAIRDHYDWTLEKAIAAEKAEPSVAEFLGGVAHALPEGYVDAWVKWDGFARFIINATQTLEKHAADKAEVVYAQALDLEKRLDYDQVVALAFSPKERLAEPLNGKAKSPWSQVLHDVSRLTAVRQLMEARAVDEPLTYTELETIHIGLNRFRNRWWERGLLAPVGENPETETQTEEDGKGPTSISARYAANIADHLEKVRATSGMYKALGRQWAREINAALRVANALALSDEPVPTDLDGIFGADPLIANENLRRALTKNFMQHYRSINAEEYTATIGSTTYKNAMQRASEIDISTRLNKMEVKGNVEGLPFRFSEAETKLFVYDNVPPLAVAAVEKLEIRRTTPAEDAKDVAMGVYLHATTERPATIVVSDEKIDQIYRAQLPDGTTDPNAIKQAEERAKYEFLYTVIHEYGHALHTVLPVATLQRWEAYRASDPTHITAYAKYRHEANHEFRYMEDFAESMAMFIMLPDTLKLVSPARYQGMEEIFSELIPTYHQGLYPRQQIAINKAKTARLRQGISDRQAREDYLAREHSRQLYPEA